jgi:hypothetical protein
MNIFGWTITRTSKKKEEEKELEIFKKCVDTLDKLTVIGKREIQSEPNIHSVQSVAELQEHLESLIEIYTNNKFSRPANTFQLSSLIQEMREIYVRYAKATSSRAMALNELHKANDHLDGGFSEYNVFGEAFKHAMNQSARKVYDVSTENVKIAAKEYFISLNAIRHVITYDITRIATNVDIIKQYHETEGYTVPQKGLEYTVRFKKLSRDEINAQIKPKEEANDE